LDVDVGIDWNGRYGVKGGSWGIGWWVCGSFMLYLSWEFFLDYS
jgi:hypothetical protein